MAKVKVKEVEVVQKVKKQSSISKDNAVKYYGTGRRKNAVARVWLMPGKGVITVNKKNIDDYFVRPFHRLSIAQPFSATKTNNQFDIVCTVKGGGCSGQAFAILHGLARALDKVSPDYHVSLRQGGFLTRDPRCVERKIYGRHKARKSTQFSKR